MYGLPMTSLHHAGGNVYLLLPEEKNPVPLRYVFRSTRSTARLPLYHL
ncbi:unnamed protein product [Ixodes pacificus]